MYYVDEFFIMGGVYSGIVVTPWTGGRTGGHRQQHAARLVLDKDDPPMIKTPEE